jgi:hypothetical protein
MTSLERRKAIATLAMDMGLYYVGNALFPNVLNVAVGVGPDQQPLPADTPMWQRIGAEFHGYAGRMSDEVQHIEAHPSKALNPFGMLQSLSPLGDHEPGKRSRLLIRYDKDGTGIYLRNPLGKFAEDITDYATQTLATLKSMMSPYAKPVYAVMANDTGFGQKLYDPMADTPKDLADGMWNFTKLVMAQPFPWGQTLLAAKSGQESPGMAATQIGLGAVGLSMSRGYPGGPSSDEIAKDKERHDFQVQQDMAVIRQKIRNGDTDGATKGRGALKDE